MFTFPFRAPLATIDPEHTRNVRSAALKMAEKLESSGNDDMQDEMVFDKDFLGFDFGGAEEKLKNMIEKKKDAHEKKNEAYDSSDSSDSSNQDISNLKHQIKIHRKAADLKKSKISFSALRPNPKKLK